MCRWNRCLVVLVWAACGALAACGAPNKPAASAQTGPAPTARTGAAKRTKQTAPEWQNRANRPVPAEFSGYVAASKRIIKAATGNDGAMVKMRQLCDGIGHRLSGSPALNKAIAWAVAAMKADGHEAVRTEKVMVPHWVRGEESAELVEPRPMKLPVLGLGNSVGTPPKGIQAEVLVARTQAELDALGQRVKGRIVLFDNAMPDWHPERGSGYGKTVHWRVNGPTKAGAMGAVAVLVRSVTARSLRTLHTGATRYASDKPKIPAAALTVEDSAMIARMVADGKRVVVRLKMAAKMHPDAPSANVIGELKGREKPDEVVVIGGHLDSWDVGQGAHDDATGCVIAMEALTVLRKLNLRPRRTIRVVLWTNEENGLRGGRAYAKDHAAELPGHVAAIESDSGGFAPVGLGLKMADKAKEAIAAGQVEGMLTLLNNIGATAVRRGWGGADISPMGPAGVPMLGLRVHGKHYFDIHHTPADTLDKVDPDELARCVATMAVSAYVLAEWPGRLGQK